MLFQTKIAIFILKTPLCPKAFISATAFSKLMHSILLPFKISFSNDLNGCKNGLKPTIDLTVIFASAFAKLP